MKKIIVVITVCFLVFWTGRIISVNQNPPITTYYELGDTLDCGDLEVSFIESHLDTPEQFKERLVLNPILMTVNIRSYQFV